MRALLAVAHKDLLLLLRDRGGMATTVALPLLLAIFFGTVFSGDGDNRGSIDIAMVVSDESAAADIFVRELQSHSSLAVVEMERGAALDAVRRGELVALLEVPEGFGQAQANLFFGDTPSVNLAIDPSRRAERGMLEGLIMQAAIGSLQGLLEQPEVLQGFARSARTMMAQSPLRTPFTDATIGFLDEVETYLGALSVEEQGDGSGTGARDTPVWSPIDIDSIDLGDTDDTIELDNAYEISFPQGVVWGLIAAAATFASSFVQERQTGTLVRLRTAPIPVWQVLGGKALACFATTVGVTVFLIAVGVVLFGLEIHAFHHLVMAIVCAGFAFTGMMMLLSVVGRTARSTENLSWSIMMVLAMIGGGMIPSVFMPGWMQEITFISPIKWTILGLEGAFWRQFSLSEMLLPCAVLLAVGSVTFAAGVAILKRRFEV